MPGDTTIRHTASALRHATIAAGVACGIVLGIAYVYNAPLAAGSSGPTAQDVFNAIVYVGAAAWFVSNAFRWVQERLLQPWNHITFGALSLAAIGIGVRVAFDLALDPPSDSASAIYQSVLAGSLFAIGAIAAFSAFQRPELPDGHAGTRFSGMVRKIATEPAHRHVALHHFSRWTAIGGGVVFAFAQFASPTVIPAAVALTCAVRFANTTRASGATRIATLAAATIAVVVVHLAAIALFPDETFTTIALAVSATILLIALVFGALASMAKSP